jgi:hypothetical protein
MEVRRCRPRKEKKKGKREVATRIVLENIKFGLQVFEFSEGENFLYQKIECELRRFKSPVSQLTCAEQVMKKHNVDTEAFYWNAVLRKARNEVSKIMR